MSTQRGNVQRTRPQKHCNKTAFKNDRHDKSQKTKALNSLEMANVCAHCKGVLEWRVQYKKYKALTSPSKCIKCGEKNVVHSYHTMCVECSRRMKACAKCGKAEGDEAGEVKRVVSQVDKARKEAEAEKWMKTLSERRRRTFKRYLDKRGEVSLEEKEFEAWVEDIRTKFEELKAMDKKDDPDDLDSDFDLKSGDEDSN